MNGLEDSIMGKVATNMSHNQRWRFLAFQTLALVLAWSTWFSAAAVIPQLRDAWTLSPSSSAWLTIAVQTGFVAGALISSLFNIADIISPRHVIMVGGGKG